MAHDSMHDSLTGRLAELLRRPRDVESQWSDDELAEVFRHQLAALVKPEPPHPPAKAVADRVPAGKSQARKASGPRPVTFAGLLHGSKPPLEMLRRAKEYAKAACKDPHGALPPDVATALYYGVIAAALVNRGEKLSTLSDQGLFRGLRWMVGQTWLDDATRDLAQRGLEHVQKGSAAKATPELIDPEKD